MTIYDEIMGQPAALRRLRSHYSSPAGRRQLEAVPPARRLTLVGMGASYHAALIAAQHLEGLGLDVRALEASEALYIDPDHLNRADPLVYISQSGASGEIAPLLERLDANTPLVALTNDESSLLARRAHHVLALQAGDEQTVATKTYLNSLAVLWLLGRHWSGRLDAAAFLALQAVHDRVAGLLARGPALAESWIEPLEPARVFVFVGTGASAVTARQAAMMIMEWLKAPALSFSIGAFRHGPLEIAQRGVGVVVFAAKERAQASAWRLARQLEEYGVAVLVVDGRETGSRAGLETPGSDLDELLTQMVDIVPAQVFVEALAHRSGRTVGFRHIDKVTTAL